MGTKAVSFSITRSLQNSHPNSTSLSALLQRFINSDTPRRGQTIHTQILTSGLKPNINISIKLLILHLKCGCLKHAQQVFDELPRRTLSAYNYLLGGYLKQGFVEKSIGIVKRLILDGEKPDGFTFSMILKAYTSRGSFILPRRLEDSVHAQLMKLHAVADDVLYTALVDAYVKNGKVGYARRVFDLMIGKNMVCSTALISGYMTQGSMEEAEEVFRKTVEKDIVVFNAMIEGYSKSVETAAKAIEVYVDMQRCGFKPNMSSYSSLIGACSVLAGFEIGQQVQGQLMKREFFTDVKTGSAILDMYSKCGRTEDARKIFDHMPQKNVFSWTSMIDGYGKNGQAIEALQVFQRMQECHVEPNYVTILSVLSACGHAGLVTEGREIFNSMERDFSIKPRMEHYSCMVDLLGRAGSLQEAWEFVLNIPEKPNADVWAALLSSCNLHDDVELANIAANELFKLNAKHRPGAYVALSNTLAAAGKWHNVSDLRDVMKWKGVLKDTGCSWFGVDSC